jgi:hypothetical protein
VQVDVEELGPEEVAKVLLQPPEAQADCAPTTAINPVIQAKVKRFEVLVIYVSIVVVHCYVGH